MKKILFLMLAAVLFAACSKDDDGDKPVTPTIEFNNYSSTLGMSLRNMLSKYGEPTMSFGTYYAYLNDDENAKEQAVSFVVNQDKVCEVMQVLGEDAYKAEDIRAFFASKFTAYGKDSESEDGEAYLYGNNEKKEKATILIAVYGNSSVVYTDLTNIPEEPEPAEGLTDLTPENAVSTFLGKSIADIKKDFEEVMVAVDGGSMINVDNDYLMAVFLETNDEGIVASMTLLYNEDLADEDIIAYYDELGYTAMPCGVDEETGAETYLFMNMATGSMFAYSDCIGRFIDPNSVPEDDEDWDEDED